MTVDLEALRGLLEQELDKLKRFQFLLGYIAGISNAPANSSTVVELNKKRVLAIDELTHLKEELEPKQ